MSGFLLRSASLLLIVLIYVCNGLESVDVLKPIVKISPAMSTGVSDDSFGYSVTAHQLFTNSTGLTFDEIISQTM